jgi:hypothetical protein
LGDLGELLRQDGQAGLADEMVYEGARDWVHVMDDWNREEAPLTQGPRGPLDSFEAPWVHPDDLARDAAHALRAFGGEALTPESEVQLFAQQQMAEIFPEGFDVDDAGQVLPQGPPVSPARVQELMAAQLEQVLADAVPAIGALPEHDYGQLTGPAFLDFLVGFDSADKYVAMTNHFLVFHEASPPEFTLLQDVPRYFRDQRAKGLKTSTLRCRFSALKKFFLHTGRGALAPQATTVEEMFNKWAKKDTTIQARTFTLEDYGRLYSLAV